MDRVLQGVQVGDAYIRRGTHGNGEIELEVAALLCKQVAPVVDAYLGDGTRTVAVDVALTASRNVIDFKEIRGSSGLRSFCLEGRGSERRIGRIRCRKAARVGVCLNRILHARVATVVDWRWKDGQYGARYG